MVEHHVEFYYVLLMTVNVTLSLIVMLAACLCCKKKVPKNDLLGLEGMVKLKNPDEVLVVTTVAKTESHGDLNISTLSNADSDKRASTAAHRSLPDIPVAETNGDTGSELYETVAEKMLSNAQNKQETSPTPSLKKQTSVSQHSSISQADDVSSPYSRVKNSPHNYAKVRTTEHPYAQLNPPSTSAAAAAAVVNTANSSATTQQSNTLNRSSQQSNDSVQNLSESPVHAEIPAASAIAGMISASQDLPYMTPPIANQHFSGDSQDSSKGYTSISVREPLANILAQQPTKLLQRNPPLSRDVNDSHYATVSDDSDETYAAIEDPNLRHLQNTAADIYTSGSETYAQIQPMQNNSIVVSVEINNTAPSVLSLNAAQQHHQQQQQQQHFDSIASGIAMAAAAAAPGPTAPPTQSHRLSLEHATPVPPPVDSLRAQMHSRQASSSSNNSSSVGNLGSPKPEKRQANSPLPPTPKSNTTLQYHLHATSSSNTSLTSGRNSVISVLEISSVQEANEAVAATAADGGAAEEQDIRSSELSPQKKHKSLSPSKDIEGMYAKVMKKNKHSGNASNSQQNSPIMSRRHHDASLGVSPLDSAAAQLLDAHAINVSAASGASRIRSNSYTAKDHGYETIPADSMRNNQIAAAASSGVVLALENRKSDIYPNMLQKERQQLEHSAAFGTQLKAPATITVNVGNAVSKISSTSLSGNKPPSVEKYYETIASPPSANNSDPGYETLKINTELELESEKKSDYDPNYEVLKSTTAHSDDGYAKVLEKKPNLSDTNDGYTKVKGDEEEEGSIPGYSTIGEVKGVTADANHNYASIAETKKLALKAEMEMENDDDDDDAVNTETEPDHYARINEARLPAAKEPSLSAASTPGRLAAEDLLSPRPQLITSPSSMNSSSFFNTSSMASSSTTVTTSTSTMSSRQTPSSSQYESLTGSETDPNYESVCYLSGSAATENPYERLQTEYSDLQLSSSDERSSSLTPATQSASTPTKLADPSLNKVDKEVGNSAAKTVVDVLVVDDYFQV